MLLRDCQWRVNHDYAPTSEGCASPCSGQWQAAVRGIMSDLRQRQKFCKAMAFYLIHGLIDLRECHFLGRPASVVIKHEFLVGVCQLQHGVGPCRAQHNRALDLLLGKDQWDPIVGEACSVCGMQSILIVNFTPVDIWKRADPDRLLVGCQRGHRFHQTSTCPSLQKCRYLQAKCQ